MRRYDLDWLRVIVFGLLIGYHVGMFFVPWDFHIKNKVVYDWVRWPMLFLNQWRLPLLFVISGMGTWYAMQKRSGWKFVRERLLRLFVPLVVGMLFIIPPQVYVERLVQGQFTGSYLQYWPAFAFRGTYPTGNLSWHHLWFLPYLLFYSILLAPLFTYLKKNPDNAWFQKMRQWIADASPQLGWLYIPFYFTYTILREFFPVTHNFTSDWFTQINYLLFFFAGFSMAGAGTQFFTRVQAARRRLLVIGIILFAIYFIMHEFIPHTVAMHFIRNIFKTANVWAWILVCTGYAARYLNKPGKVLQYANEAVYPCFILHQTIMMLLCYWVIDWNWDFWPKAMLITIGTFGGSWLLYAGFIRPFDLVRPLFGLKSTRVNKKCSL